MPLTFSQKQNQFRYTYTLNSVQKSIWFGVGIDIDEAKNIASIIKLLILRKKGLLLNESEEQALEEGLDGLEGRLLDSLIKHNLIESREPKYIKLKELFETFINQKNEVNRT